MTDEELLSRARVFDAGPPPTVNQFVLDEDDDQPMNLTVEFRGKTGWAICNGRCCLSKEDSDFEYETFPSSRTDDFIARTRFASAREAFAFLAEWKPKAREDALKSPHMIRWKDQQAIWASERKTD